MIDSIKKVSESNYERWLKLANELLPFVKKVIQYKSWQKFEEQFYEKKDPKNIKSLMDRSISDYGYNIWKDSYGINWTFRFFRWNQRHDEIAITLTSKNIPSLEDSLLAYIEHQKLCIATQNSKQPYMGAIEREIRDLFDREYTKELFNFHKHLVSKRLSQIADDIANTDYDTTPEHSELY